MEVEVGEMWLNTSKNIYRRDFPSLGDVSIGGFILIFVVFYIFIVPTVDLSDSKNHRESRETQWIQQSVNGLTDKVWNMCLFKWKQDKVCVCVRDTEERDYD